MATIDFVMTVKFPIHVVSGSSTASITQILDIAMTANRKFVDDCSSHLQHDWRGIVDFLDVIVPDVSAKELVEMEGLAWVHESCGVDAEFTISDTTVIPWCDGRRSFRGLGLILRSTLKEIPGALLSGRPFGDCRDLLQAQLLVVTCLEQDGRQTNHAEVVKGQLENLLHKLDVHFGQRGHQGDVGPFLIAPVPHLDQFANSANRRCESISSPVMLVQMAFVSIKTDSDHVDEVAEFFGDWLLDQDAIG